MKKIYFSLLLFATLFVSSCSMDTKPFGALDDQTAIRDKEDLRQFRNNLYTGFRSATSGGWLYIQDLMMDEFHGVIGNGNRNGESNNGIILSSNGDIKSLWASCYSRIAVSNKVIEKADGLLAKEDVTDADKAEIGRYRAEAYFSRAYFYFFLADHFCQSYTQTNPEAEHSGLPLSVSYNPSGDIATYPDRSTLVETFKLIQDDLDEAYVGLKAYEATGASDVAALLSPNAAYVSSYAIEAMQARVALVKGDWATALAKAKDVIESGRYRLTSIADYAKLWTDDEGSEVIWRPFRSKPSELGSSTGAAYLSTNNQFCDYLPTYPTLIGYGDGDCRFDAFFSLNQTLKVEGGNYVAYQFSKFPGNVALRTDESNNLINMTKPFRLSEMYLIAAEACARTNQDGSQYMNDFLANRVEDYQNATYTSEQLLNTSLAQRKLELIGEGFRMSDLRRTHKGFTRNAKHPEISDAGLPSIDGIIVKAGSALSYSDDDYRFTWPIPKSELDANPHLAGQQNPGYGN